MVNIRIGNDIPLIWKFYTRGESGRVPYNLEGRNVKIEMTTEYGGKIYVEPDILGNAASWTYLGRLQKTLGNYTLTFYENFGQNQMKALDKIQAFRLVPLQEVVESGIIEGCNSSLEVSPIVIESDISKVIDYNDLVNKPQINGVTLQGDKSAADLGLESRHPYISLERKGKYLYEVTFDRLPEDNGGESPVGGGCSSYVDEKGKLRTNLDWGYANTAIFRVITSGFEGMSFIGGLDDGQMDDALIAQLPYRMRDGVNNYGIKVATHILFNDWGWTGCGSKSISLTRLPYLILSRVKSMATIAQDLDGILGNLYAPDGLQALDYLLQIIVTDGTTTYALIPPTSEGESYELVNATAYPKMANFRYVARAEVSRYDMDLQTRPTGIERFNMMPCPLEDLRFTKAYEAPTRLSEFIGLRGTTKDSTDAELESIYEAARAEYLRRERDGKTWQTMESAVYGDRLDALYIQEDWSENLIPATTEYVDKEIARVENEIPTKVSELENDADYISDAPSDDDIWGREKGKWRQAAYKQDLEMGHF